MDNSIEERYQCEKLIKYMSDLNLNPYSFSKICKVSPNVIYRAFRGEKITEKNANKIHKVTRGFIVYLNVR